MYRCVQRPTACALLPAGRNTDLPWLGIDSLQFTLDGPEPLTASEVTIQGLRGIDYGPATITGSGTTYTITFARPIKKADRVTITIAGPGIATYTRRLDVLPGDFHDKGVVTSAMRPPSAMNGSVSTVPSRQSLATSSASVP